MKINIPFFYKKLPLIIERDNLYLGQVYNNETKIPERKILCTGWFDSIEDVLFEAPHYSIDGKKGYTVKQLVELGTFLKYLGYPERLRTKDIRKIYNQVLSSTRTLHQYCKIFGVARVSQTGNRRNTYWPFAHLSSIIGHEQFYDLEELISLPTIPSDLEQQNDDYSFRKRLFFIP